MSLDIYNFSNIKEDHPNIDFFDSQKLYDIAYIEYYEKKQYDKLLETCILLLSKFPSSKEAKWASQNFSIVDASIIEGEKFISSGDLKTGIECYTKAIEIGMNSGKHNFVKHDYVVLLYYRAKSYQKVGEIEKAIDDFRNFLLKSADLVTSSSTISFSIRKRAWIYDMEIMARSCLTDLTFKKILSIYDFDINYLKKYRHLYNWKNYFKEAQKKLNESPLDANFYMGVISLLQGDNAKAIQYLVSGRK